MSIEAELRSQLTAAIRTKDQRVASVVRIIIAKVTERRTAKGFKGEVDDALYLEVITAYQKTMAKALKEYEGIGERGREQADGLRFEVEFCGQFLPRQLTEGEVRIAVRKAVADLGAVGPKMTGRVVGAVMKAHKGKVAAELVKQVALKVLS